MYAGFKTYVKRLRASILLCVGILLPFSALGAMYTTAIGLGYIATDVMKRMVVDMCIVQMLRHYTLQKQRELKEQARKERFIYVNLDYNQERVELGDGLSLFVPQELRGYCVKVDLIALQGVKLLITECDRMCFDDPDHQQRSKACLIGYKNKIREEICASLSEESLANTEKRDCLKSLYESATACIQMLDTHDRNARDSTIMHAIFKIHYWPSNTQVINATCLGSHICNFDYVAWDKQFKKLSNIDYTLPAFFLELIGLELGGLLVARIAPAKIYNAFSFLQRHTEQSLYMGVHNLAARCGVLKGMQGLGQKIASIYGLDFVLSLYLSTRWYDYCKAKNILDSCWCRGGNTISRLLRSTWNRICKI